MDTIRIVCIAAEWPFQRLIGQIGSITRHFARQYETRTSTETVLFVLCRIVFLYSERAMRCTAGQIPEPGQEKAQ